MLPLARRFVSETVLNDVRVVAVDQSIAQGAVAGRQGHGQAGADRHAGGLAAAGRTRGVADRLGKITLAIRAVDGVAEQLGAGLGLWRRRLPGLAEGTTPSGPRMRVIEGKDARDVTFQ